MVTNSATVHWVPLPPQLSNRRDLHTACKYRQRRFSCFYYLLCILVISLKMHNKQHWSRTCLSEYACTKIYKSSIPRWLKPRPRRSWRLLFEKNRYNFVRVLSTVHLNSSVLEAHLKVDVFLVSFAMNPWVSSSGCTPPVEHWILGPPIPTYLLLFPESQKVKPRMFGKFLLPLCLQQMEIWLEEEPFPWRWMGSKSTTDRRQSSLEPISFPTELSSYSSMKIEFKSFD